MKKLMIKYGIIAGSLLVVIPLISNLFMEQIPDNYTAGEIIGYSTMVLSLLLIFVAQNEYRKQTDEYRIGFAKGLLLGLAISTFAGVGFGFYNWLYVEFINPEFMEQYFNYYIENIRSNGSGQEQINTQIAQLQSEKTFWMNPWMQFIGMFMTVFGVGIVISLASAGIMSRLKVPESDSL